MFSHPTFCWSVLQHYPYNIQGFAHSGDPDIMTYLVKHAIFASAAHLVFGPCWGLRSVFHHFGEKGLLTLKVGTPGRVQGVAII